MSLVSAAPLFTARNNRSASSQTEQSLRFNSADSAYLNRTPASAGNRKTWTWAGWVKLSEIPNTTARYVFQALSGSSRTTIKFDSDKLYLDLINTSNQLVTTQVFRDPSAWYHIVAAVDTTDATSSNRAKLYVNGVQVTAFSTATYPSQNADTYVNSTTAHYIGAYDPSFNHFNGYLADIHFIDGQALDPTDFGEFDATTGVWNPIEYTGSYGTNGFHLDFADNSSAAALGYDAAGSNDWTVNNITAAEYIVSDAPTLLNGAMIVRGVSGGSVTVTISGTGNKNYFTSSDGINWTWQSTGTSATHTANYVASGGAGTNIRTAVSSGAFQYAMWNTNTNFDSTSNTTTDTTGLTFTTATANGGNGDSLLDSPTNGGTANDTGLGGEVAGNYATLNPLDTKLIHSNGNLDATANPSQTWVSGRGTFGVTAGKWYWEITLNGVSSTSDNVAQVGIHALTSALPANDAASDANAYVYVNYQGYKYNNSTGSSYGATWTTGDVIGVAYDADNGTLAFYKNGSSQGTAYSSLSASKVFAPIVTLGRSSTSTSVSVNFGQRAFAFQAPSGFRPLATPFLDTPTIEDGSAYMDVALYTGNGGTKTISGLGFSPDLMWIKNRNSTYHHALYDTIRGATKMLSSSETAAEITYSSVTSQTAGFEISGAESRVNENNLTYAAWTWDAGSQRVYAAEVTGAFNPGAGADKIFDGSTSTEASHSGGASDTFTWQLAEPLTVSTSLEVYLNSGLSKFRVNGGTQSSALSSGSWHNLGFTGSLTSLEVQGDGVYAPRLAAIRIDGTIVVDPARNTQGTIASTVKASPSAGFSVVTYTGTGSAATVGHGLNAALGMIFVKSRSNTMDWCVYHSSLANTQFLKLNTTGNAQSFNAWNSTSPTSTVFSIGNIGETNTNTYTYVAYCFAPVEGYSAFGSYVGTGSATNSPFIWTGFRPQWILVKNISINGSNWRIIDAARNTYNEANLLLNPNSSNSEQTTTANEFDFLSNGFKLRGADNDTNGSGETLIYYAVAENPFSIARAR